MNRNDITSLVADIVETMDRVRDLDIEAHRRAAALQCLADARRHLESVRVLPSIPPPCSNQAMREKATEAFRESRRILKEIVR